MQQVSQAYSLLEDLVRPIDPDLTALQSSMLAVESPDDNTARKDGASKVAAGKMSRVVVLLRAIVMVEDLTTENNELKAGGCMVFTKLF